MSEEIIQGEIVPHGASRGRPLTFTREIAQEICERIALGESLRSVCRDDAMPEQRTVFRWLDREDEHGEYFRQQYAKARERQADTHADDLNDIADDGSNDWMEQRDKDGDFIGWRVNGEHIARSKLRIDTRKWTASKLRPKKYGDATILRHTDAEGQKIETAETSILELARLTVFLLSKAGQIADKPGVVIEQES